jgi:glycosyltransferase involved in cell wall biosynthesis
MKEKLIVVRPIKHPKISVIIPTLNEEKYIEKTLLSLKAQTTRLPYEVIISDGKSKDRTVEIAKKYVNKIVICNRKGISVGRNLGAKYAEGKILIFLDADTILLPNTLEEVYREVKKDNIALVSCPLLPSSSSASFYFIYSFFNQFARNSIKVGKPQISGAFMAVKKSVFDAVGGFDENIKTLEDFDFSEKVSKFGKVKIVDNTFVLTSPRRLKKWGIFESIFKYTFEIYLPYLLARAPNWRIYKPVR